MLSIRSGLAFAGRHPAPLHSPRAARTCWQRRAAAPAGLRPFASAAADAGKGGDGGDRLSGKVALVTGGEWQPMWGAVSFAQPAAGTHPCAHPKLLVLQPCL